jgi:hypothetical protein
METKVTSKQFSLSLNDFWKGLLMAVGSPIIAIIIQSLNAGSLTINWKTIATVGLSALLMYLSKNFFDKPKLVVNDPSPNAMQQVKNGTAELKLMAKLILVFAFLSIGMFANSQSFFKSLPKPRGLTATLTPVTQNVIRPVANLASYAIPDNLGLTGVGISWQHQEFNAAEDKWKVIYSVNALTWYSTANKILYGIAIGALNNLIMIGVATDSHKIYGTVGIGININ